MTACLNFHNNSLKLSTQGERIWSVMLKTSTSNNPFLRDGVFRDGLTGWSSGFDVRHTHTIIDRWVASWLHYMCTQRHTYTLTHTFSQTGTHLHCQQSQLLVNETNSCRQPQQPVFSSFTLPTDSLQLLPAQRSCLIFLCAHKNTATPSNANGVRTKSLGRNCSKWEANGVWVVVKSYPWRKDKNKRNKRTCFG